MAISQPESSSSKYGAWTYSIIIPESLLEMQVLGHHPELLSQNLKFNRFPVICRHIQAREILNW